MCEQRYGNYVKNKSTGDFMGLRKDNDNVGEQRREEEWHIHAV